VRRKASHPLYEQPRLYDLAFSFRDIAAECDGILAIAQRHRITPRAIGDIACGPAHHLRELSRRGIDAYGIDLNRDMLAYARSLNRGKAEHLRLRIADMRCFTMPAKLDLQLCLFDSFSHCTTDEDAVATLRSAAGALRPAGLLILELTHPSDYVAASSKRTQRRWAAKHDGMLVKTRYSTTRIDPIRETYVASMTIDATFRDGRPPQRMVDRQLHRLWMPSGIRYVAGRSGYFDVVAWYGDFSPKIGFDMALSAWRMIVVLRRH